MKGFRFTKQEKAFSKLFAGEADAVYGDAFERQERSVCGIGNNVTLVFENMDFGETGTAHLTICGKALHEVNNIRLLTEWEDGRKEQESLEFFHADESVEVVFDMIPKCGKTKISFVFLPGSAFDFAWFQFE